MKLSRYIAITVLLVAGAAFVGTANARVGTERPENGRRVIAHTEEEANGALARGCTPVRKVKGLTSLRCPEGVSEALSLMEDVRVFALEEGARGADRDVGALRAGTASASANKQMGAHNVHAAGNTGVGRVVVVLDTGYNYLHQELSSSYAGGKDFVHGDNDPMDDEGHGSHVAGIITADGVDPSAKGVAPDAAIIAGKVLDEYGSGYFSDIVAGIYWAVDGEDGIYGTPDDFGADAINVSVGTTPPYTYKGSCDGVLPDLTNAISYAKSKGIVVAVAAGNSGVSGVSIPGCITHSTTAGAVDSKDRIARFSARGSALDIVAPGVSIYSAVLGNGYAAWSGTSMATPMISGVAALIKYAHPNYIASDVENRIFTTAKDLGKSGKDTTFGWGRVRADFAVQ